MQCLLSLDWCRSVALADFLYIVICYVVQYRTNTLAGHTVEINAEILLDVTWFR